MEHAKMTSRDDDEVMYQNIRNCVYSGLNSKEKFKSDVFEALNIQDHPKAERMFEIAWEYGRGDGFWNTWVLCCELTELMN